MLSDLQRWWPLLLAGAAGMFVGWIGKIRYHMASWIERNCVAVLIVDPEVSNTYSTDIDNTIAWLGTIPELARSRRRTMGPAMNYDLAGIPREEVQLRQTALAPGLYWVRIFNKRCMLNYNVESREHNTAAHRTIKISALTRDREFADRIVAAIAAHRNSHTRGHIHVDSVSATRTVGTYVPMRPAASVITDGDVVERIVAVIRRFHAQRPQYARLHLPRRIMILLEGPPGNGKTSAVHAVASELGMGLAVFNLNGMNDSMLQAQWVYATSQKILLLEDVDAMGVDLGPRAPQADGRPPKAHDPVEIRPAGLGDKRLSGMAPEERAMVLGGEAPRPVASASDKDKVSLSTLLNLLDGLASAPEQVVIMTTNHVENLDPALLRDERTHVRVHLGPPSWDAARRMWDRFDPDGGVASWGEIRGRLRGLPAAHDRGPGVTASTLQRMFKAATLGGEGPDAIRCGDGPHILSA